MFNFWYTDLSEDSGEPYFAAHLCVSPGFMAPWQLKWSGHGSSLIKAILNLKLEEVDSLMCYWFGHVGNYHSDGFHVCDRCHAHAYYDDEYNQHSMLYRPWWIFRDWLARRRVLWQEYKQQRCQHKWRSPTAYDLLQQVKRCKICGIAELIDKAR